MIDNKMTSSEKLFYEDIGRKMKLARLYFNFKKEVTAQALCITEEELEKYEEGQKEISLYFYKNIETVLKFKEMNYKKLKQKSKSK